MLTLWFDPVRLAEKMSVLDIISRGRASYVLGIGHRPEEYAHFGVDLDRRGERRCAAPPARAWPYLERAAEAVARSTASG